MASIACIPCGHVYGRSCLEKWLAQCGKKSATCPQCGKMFRQKNIINLYAPEIVVPNNDLEKQVLSLRDKNEFLENQQQKLIEEVKEYKRQILYQQRLINESSSKRQNEFVLDGARVMGIDASSQIIVASGRAPGVSAEHVLTKICMFSRQETKVCLPPNTKAVRDICITPGGLAIFASLGRKLSLLSMTTNNVVLQYDLPLVCLLEGVGFQKAFRLFLVLLIALYVMYIKMQQAPGWSCSGDQTGPNHVYAGLQNGMLLVFDTRQTKGPLHSLSGLSTNPVHTIHSVVDDSGSMKIISASSIGPCIWDVDGTETRPNLLTGTENQGVCISLACAAPSSDLIVASFRPRVEFSGDGSASQMGISQSPTLSGSGKLGCHALLRRTSSTSFVKEQICNGNVSELRMSKSAIIPCSGAGQHLFAYGDESLRGVRTWRLPSFQPCTDLRPHRQPILDLRFAESSTGEKYLGCLSEEKLQVFRIRS
uniref:RING-type E3 ubiquitin transferase n=1 Tax=Aegilops tauschii TaxID=37682 RepID=N1QQG8_AEGTA